MKKRIGSYPRVRIEGGGRAVVSQAGGVLLVETVRKAGLDTVISAALTPWRKPRAVHDPGKILLDLALAVALGGDCLADVAMLRAEPAVFGSVASDPTVSRLIDTLAVSGEKALRAIRAARAEARQRVWRLADRKAPDAGGTVTVDLDGVLVIAHSDKEDAAPTWKRTYGHHPLMGFVDHGPGGTGEPVAALLRPGNAGSNTADQPIAELELRHRLWARAEDRIRAARATGLRNPPLHRTAQNRIWLEIVQLALDLLAWLPMLALTGKARLWEPRRLRLRLFSAAGQLVTTGRRRILRLARHWPWTGHITAVLDRLALLPNPG
ncbi:transposase [Streptomyces verrucosisporus]|uniref:transposase n=1 Tax=Streptomyces verrucosisporus TaxID=1695161 RepID=UPI0019D035C5|nr:transposase [Streptomyces verrucosisporus]MBN3930969.1 transposase [Streptomyces verrucosisporus]